MSIDNHEVAREVGDANQHDGRLTTKVVCYPTCNRSTKYGTHRSHGLHVAGGGRGREGGGGREDPGREGERERERDAMMKCDLYYNVNKHVHTFTHDASINTTVEELIMMMIIL